MRLLKFNEGAYNMHVGTIQKTLTVLKDASKELEKHGVLATPKSLSDGKVYKKALEHYRGKYENSALSQDISFEKYMDFTDTDIAPLKLLQQQIQDQLAVVFRFYPEQHEFFSFFEHRREPEIHAKAGKKVELPITKLFKWVSEDEIEVTLSEKYFEVHATNQRQVDKIAAIENLILACKEMDIEHGLAKEVLGQWVTSLSPDLEKYEIDCYYVLKTIC